MLYAFQSYIYTWPQPAFSMYQLLLHHSELHGCTHRPLCWISVLYNCTSGWHYPGANAIFKISIAMLNLYCLISMFNCCTFRRNFLTFRLNFCAPSHNCCIPSLHCYIPSHFCCLAVIVFLSSIASSPAFHIRLSLHHLLLYLLQ